MTSKFDCFKVGIRLFLKSATLGSLLSLLATQAAHASNGHLSHSDLIVNGGFETTPPLNHSKWGTFKSIEGWTATQGGEIEIQQDDYAGRPDQGRNLLELDSYGYTVGPEQPLGVYQDLQTQKGQQYRLSFDYSPRPERPAQDNQFDVLFDGNVLQHFEEGPGGQQTAWKTYSTTVEASGDTSRLTFDYTGTRDTYGAYIDNVRLVPLAPPPVLAPLIGLETLPLATNHAQHHVSPQPPSPKPTPAHVPEPATSVEVIAAEGLLFLGLLRKRR